MSEKVNQKPRKINLKGNILTATLVSTILILSMFTLVAMTPYQTKSKAYPEVPTNLNAGYYTWINEVLGQEDQGLITYEQAYADILQILDKFLIPTNTLTDEIRKHNGEVISKIMGQYEGVDKDWTEDFEDQLGSINEEITNYEGDVREGRADLEGQLLGLQEDVERAADEDPELVEFKSEIKRIDTGVDKLKSLTVPSRKEIGDSLIKKIKTWMAKETSS